MDDRRFIAVIDIGKTNAKLVLHDLEQRDDIFVRTEANRVRRDGPYPHYDTDRLFAFLIDALADCAARHRVDAISVTTHGASVVLAGDDDLALPVLDYEFDGPEETRDAYDRIRPGFNETFSPRLPNGLNVGAQLFWLQHRFPDAFAAARHILCYPQYWVWRLTDVPASEVTSLGCHTDLWAPAESRFSSLVERMGWLDKLPPLRSAFEPLGLLLPAIAKRVGLGERRIPVHCGIHDSNASLLPHILSRPAPFSVLSTGTWTIAFAVGGSLKHLVAERDMLANVDALGRPIPSARFMGGREFDLLTGGGPSEPSEVEIARVLERQVMALPSFAPGTGPFPYHAGRWSHDPAGLTPGERTAAASLYCALMSAEMLALTKAGGPTVVEGPFSRNKLYLGALGALTDRPVAVSGSATGTSDGAAFLAATDRQSDGSARRHEWVFETLAPQPAVLRYGEAWHRIANRTG